METRIRAVGGDDGLGLSGGRVVEGACLEEGTTHSTRRSERGGTLPRRDPPAPGYYPAAAIGGCILLDAACASRLYAPWREHAVRPPAAPPPAARPAVPAWRAAAARTTVLALAVLCIYVKIDRRAERPGIMPEEHLKTAPAFFRRRCCCSSLRLLWPVRPPSRHPHPQAKAPPPPARPLWQPLLRLPAPHRLQTSPVLGRPLRRPKLLLQQQKKRSRLEQQPEDLMMKGAAGPPLPWMTGSCALSPSSQGPNPLGAEKHRTGRDGGEMTRAMINDVMWPMVKQGPPATTAFECVLRARAAASARACVCEGLCHGRLAGARVRVVGVRPAAADGHGSTRGEGEKSSQERSFGTPKQRKRRGQGGFPTACTPAARAPADLAPAEVHYEGDSAAQ